MTTTRVESEFKFAAPVDLAMERVDDLLNEVGLRCRMADSTTHLDVYLDDARRSLLRHGVGLRLRRSRHGTSLCCKDEGTRQGAMFVRDEIELPWSGGVPTSAAELPEPLRDLVEPFVLERPLAPLVTLEVQRDHRELAAGEHDIGELMYDRVAASAAERRAEFAELELEVRDDLPACERFAARLQTRFDLRAAAGDKARHAAKLLGVAVDAATPQPADRSFRAFVVAHAAVHLAAIRHAWAAVRNDRGPEFVHELRVRLRRLRALARTAEDVWPDEDAARVQRTLRDFGRALGPLREADVMLQQVPDWLHAVPGPLLLARDALLERLAQVRAAGRQQAMAVLRSAAHRETWSALEQTFTAAAMVGPAAELPAAAASRDRLGRAVRQLRRLAQQASPHDDIAALHELRLMLKRVRYLVEEFACDAPKVLRRLQRAQERLGAVCDHHQSAHRLLALLEPGATDSGADRATFCALVGALGALEGAAEQRARRRTGKALQRLAAKASWRALEAVEPS